MASKHILSSLKILIIMSLLTLLLLLLLSFFYYKIRFGTGTVTVLVFFVYAISCFIGGLLAGKHFLKRRALWGMAFGLLYFLLLLAISFAAGKEVFGNLTHLAGVLAACVTASALGGFIS